MSSWGLCLLPFPQPPDCLHHHQPVGHWHAGPGCYVFPRVVPAECLGGGMMGRWAMNREEPGLTSVAAGHKTLPVSLSGPLAGPWAHPGPCSRSFLWQSVTVMQEHMKIWAAHWEQNGHLALAQVSARLAVTCGVEG